MTTRAMAVSTFIMVTMVVMVKGDMYMHMPRGSNNRLDEMSAERTNANRMFDSQNNNRGGYNTGDSGVLGAHGIYKGQYQMRYFQSAPEKAGISYFPIEWTNQHGCGKNIPGDPIKLNCEIIMQYMCQPFDKDKTNRDTIRDGTQTGKNPYTPPAGNTMETEYMFGWRKEWIQASAGMNEPYAWRDKCETRPRNKRLFTADQVLEKDKSTATRQNPKANRNGYECPEERDYYPYWHPTDWKDIAVLTEDEGRCDSYKAKSFNVKPYYDCVETFSDKKTEAHYSFANNEASCTQRGGKWREYHSYLEKLLDANGKTPATEGLCNSEASKKGVPKNKVKFAYAIYGKQKECLVTLDPLDCKLAAYSRVNHLGNGGGGGEPLQANSYQWELPHFYSGEQQRCVFRIRYNISTDDYDPQTTDAGSNKNDDVISNDPKVSVGLANDQQLQLAINTAQTGRTFQDRSHVFDILPRKEKMGTSNIYNLNVRGKRGNIVQTFPAVEYDFAPTNLTVTTDDLVHFQWTGSNTHYNQAPAGDGQAGDAGEGKRGSDRSNILSMKKASNNFFSTLEDSDNLAHHGEVIWAAKPANEGRLSAIDVGLQLASAGHYRCLECGTEDELVTGTTMDELLNNAPASFEGIILKFKKEKTHKYGCTRNNNFSNRSQKATLIVKSAKK